VQEHQRSLRAELNLENWLGITYLLMERKKTETIYDVPADPPVEEAAFPCFKLII